MIVVDDSVELLRLWFKWIIIILIIFFIIIFRIIGKDVIFMLDFFVFLVIFNWMKFYVLNMVKKMSIDNEEYKVGLMKFGIY